MLPVLGALASNNSFQNERLIWYYDTLQVCFIYAHMRNIATNVIHITVPLQS